MITVALGALVFVPMLIEAAIARRHDRALRAQGAIEPRGDVYAAMQFAYPAAFLAMLAEGAWRHSGAGRALVFGLVVFTAAKALKYWAIVALGPRWTFRVLVPAGSHRTLAGPYRWMAHPNYVGVAGEIVGCAIATRALVSGPIAFVVFGSLMLRRIRVEERALAAE
jgi:methyltransferase